jgi:hypothetical protein
MRSIKLGDAKDLAEWFEVKPTQLPPPALHLLAAVIPDGKRAWIIDITGMGERVDLARESFLTFINSITLVPEPDGGTKLEWKLPDGFTVIGEFGQPTIAIARGENSVLLTIAPLGEARADTPETLVDYWAKSLNAGELSAKERGNCIKEITVSGRKAWLIEIKGKELESPRGAVLAYKTPKNWKLQPPGEFRKVAFDISRAGDQDDMSVCTLPAADNLALNINRWRQQIELPGQDEKTAVGETKPVTIDNQKGRLVDLHNPDAGKRILAAVVKQGGMNWYFKMMGESELVESERENFQSFLKSVRFPNEENPKPATPGR